MVSVVYRGSGTDRSWCFHRFRGGTYDLRTRDRALVSRLREAKSDARQGVLIFAWNVSPDEETLTMNVTSRRCFRTIVLLWGFLGVGHLLTVDILMFHLKFPFLTDTAKDLPVFEYLAGVHFSFRPIFIASPTFLSTFKGFSIWLGVSCLGICALTQQLKSLIGRSETRRRLALIHLLLSLGFLVLSVWGFFIVPTAASLGVAIASLILLFGKENEA